MIITACCLSWAGLSEESQQKWLRSLGTRFDQRASGKISWSICVHLRLLTFMGWACRLLHDDQKESGLLPVLGRLIKGFNFQHQNRDHAVDLVEALHVVLRLLERLSSAGVHHCTACFCSIMRTVLHLTQLALECLSVRSSECSTSCKHDCLATVICTCLRYGPRAMSCPSAKGPQACMPAFSILLLSPSSLLTMPASAILEEQRILQEVYKHSAFPRSKNCSCALQIRLLRMSVDSLLDMGKITSKVPSC